MKAHFLILLPLIAVMLICSSNSINKNDKKLVFDAVIDNGIYVIIDWHSHTIKTDQAITFFSKMAEKYKDYPNVIYEIFNKPETDSWSDVKTYSIKLIETIRAIDKGNFILVGSPHWDQFDNSSICIFNR
ncbi:MAG: cellulase family glycosylhydrolase [Dysgonamonadaceae bacterium]|nr:cellulase family glycosylhydrolase [Dysgonamonadaceae bacterium]